MANSFEYKTVEAMPIMLHVENDVLPPVPVPIFLEGSVEYVAANAVESEMVEQQLYEILPTIILSIPAKSPFEVYHYEDELCTKINACLKSPLTDNGVSISKFSISAVKSKLNGDRLPVAGTKEFDDYLNAAKQEVLNDSKNFKQSSGPWTCSCCGTVNEGKFCTNCGERRDWICECGQFNGGKFCTNCGKPKVPVPVITLGSN